MPSAATQLPAMAGSRLAIVTAVGKPRATSAAKLGPDNTARGEAGVSSAAISDIVLSEFVSIPLAQSSSFRRGGKSGASLITTLRRNCAGTTISAPSAPASAASGSAVAAMAGSSAMPGR